MRLLILNSKQADAELEPAVRWLIKETGHTPVTWTKSLTSKDYDAVLAIPYAEYNGDDCNEDFLNELIDDGHTEYVLSLGRGIYEGVSSINKINGIVIYSSNDKINAETLCILKGFELHRNGQTDYNNWGALTIEKEASLFMHLREFLTLNSGNQSQSPEGEDILLLS